MYVKYVLNCIHNGFGKALKSLKCNLLKPAETLVRVFIVRMHLAWTENQSVSKGVFFSQLIHCNRQWYSIVPSRCSPGYYGNPMVIGNSCKRCDCNGNSDPNLIFNECHNVTGNCQHCWGNTAGANCERCATGFYGDAITAKNCRGGSDEWISTQSRDVWSILERLMRLRRASMFKGYAWVKVLLLFNVLWNLRSTCAP